MQKVSPGQPLRIPASTFNTMLDAAADYQRRAHNRGSSLRPIDVQNGIALIQNQSGTDSDRFDVMAITGVLITPAQNALEFASLWALTVETPVAGDGGKFAVLQEPVNAGGFGRALIVGVTPVYVARLSGETSEVAGIKDGQHNLEAGISGAQILWEDAGGATPHLALVRMLEQPILRMRVTAVQGDYLVCQRWSDSAWSATDENVVRPYLLRTSITSRNGITYTYSNGFTRTAAQGADNETQVIVSSFYTSGDEIFAAQMPYTGVMVSGSELKLLDINADGRAWARSNP